MKIKIVALVSLLLFTGCSFSKQPEAFLGTKFGMSSAEVENVVGKKLLTGDEYLADASNPKFFDWLAKKYGAIAINNVPLDKEYADRSKDFFMSRIMLYDFPAGTDFNFLDDKLNNVSVNFDVMFGNADDLLGKIKESLEKNYKFIVKEDSKDVPGAYTLKYQKDDVNVDLWINAVGQNKYVNLDIHYLPFNKAYDEELKKREQKAL
ncbi:MAG: hypothetical protein WC843_03110 [Candidatus Gracilibacteria bacterium]|jgi:hypothetical protein